MNKQNAVTNKKFDLSVATLHILAMTLMDRIRSSAGCDRPDTEDDAPYQTSNRKGKGWTKSNVFDRR